MQLLNIKQFADEKGVPRSTVYRWIRQGRLPVVWEERKIARIPSDATLLQKSKEN